ncbi:hypothetical protein WI25_34885 [Burkholderia cepacia]|uniref:EAL domain-containing protein n=1 Tax=Burkholderia cepacia TaxID=292 RepID=UPI0007582CC9|nr:EAL domain-containing protein [Burkholderia cepacia]KUY85261.1 hypothetical protein WI25_34885 [Burkholderia cepacia]
MLLATLNQHSARFPLLTSLGIVKAWYQGVGGTEPRHAPCAIRIPSATISASLDLASDIVESLYDKEFNFTFQAIRAAQGRQHDLYRTCSVQVPHVEFGLLARASYMPSLERASRELEFDSLAVSQLIGRLIADPTAELGYIISALSATPSAYWNPAFELLESYPDVASRFVIEIDEGALVKTGRARSFANQLSRLGCRLAIRHFGVRYGALSAAEFPCPDIIKIDPLLLWRAGDSTRAASQLMDMVSLARDMASDVVIDGVATATQLELAVACGATWVQGPLFAPPVMLWTEPHSGRSASARYA